MGEISAEICAMMGARWAKLGPSRQELASKIGHDGARMAILASTWEVLKACWEDFFVIFPHWLDSKNNGKPKEIEDFAIL